MKEIKNISNPTSMSNMINNQMTQNQRLAREQSLNKESIQYILEITYEEYMNQRQLYRWRQKTHHPILRITGIKQNVKKKTVEFTCEKILFKMDQIKKMKVQEIIYCMSEMLLGYQSLLMRLGWVCVEEKMVGVNEKGELLLWVNQNPVKNTPGLAIKLINQKDILIKITQILQEKCPLDSKIFFSQIKQLPKTFTSYLDYLMQFKLRHKLKIVPKIVVNNVNVNNKIDISIKNNKATEIHQKQRNEIHLQSSPLISSMSVNYIPAVGSQQLFTSFNSNNINNNINKNVNINKEIKTMTHITNSQSQSQFIGINRLHSVHSLLPLPVVVNNKSNHLQQQRQRKTSKTTSIIYNNVNSSTIINDQSYNFINNNNDNSYGQFINSNVINRDYNNNNNTSNIYEQQQQQSVRSMSKINFSYSQKRNDNLYTPRQSTFLRDYTSDRMLPALGRIQSETNQQVIKEFTLKDDNKREVNINNKNCNNHHNNVQKMSKSANDINKSINNNTISNNTIINKNYNSNKNKRTSRSIVPSYTISYNPITDSIILQNQLQLKKSSISTLSQKTFKSQQLPQCIDQNINMNNVDNILSSRCQNKSSMTTNHRSAASHQYQSMDSKCSNMGVNNYSNYGNNNTMIRNNSNNDVDGLDNLNRRNNNMFASNSSHRVSYSMIKDSFVQNQGGVKNTKSILVNTSQQFSNNNNSFSHQQFNINNNNKFSHQQQLNNNNNNKFSHQQQFNNNNNNKFSHQQQFNINNNNKFSHQQQFNNNIQKSLMNPNIKSTLTTSLFTKQPVIKNTMMNNSQQKIQQLVGNVGNSYNSSSNNNNGMYTFGGLIVVANEKVEGDHMNIATKQSQVRNNINLNINSNGFTNNLSNQSKKLANLSPTIIASSTIIDNHQQPSTNNKKTYQHLQQQTKIKLSTTSVKSIEQLYKNINAKSQKKSIIILNNSSNNSNTNSNNKSIAKDCSYSQSQEQQQHQQKQYKIHLSPATKHQPPVTPIKQSHIIHYNNNTINTNMNNNNNHFKKNHLQYLLSPTINNNDLKHSQQLQSSHIQQQKRHFQQEEFDYNQWRGITGLLNQSNVHELKQSIHCGPQIRAAPLNIKLQLLDKFGREIGHSILPNTPNGLMMTSTTQNNGFANSCVRSIFIDEQ